MKCERCKKEFPHRTGRFCGSCFPKDKNPAMEWISVEDQLPPKMKLVLCFYKLSGEYSVVYLAADRWNKLHDFNQINDPAYWMPLPEPPKEKP